MIDAASALNPLLSEYPRLGYRLEDDSVAMLYDGRFIGKVSLKKTTEDFIDWVLYCYDMEHRTSNAECGC